MIARPLPGLPADGVDRVPAVDPDDAWDEFAASEFAADPIAGLGARVLADIAAEGPVPLLLGRIHARAHTILFGTGGCRKGTLASSWIVQLAAQGHRVLVVDYEDHPDEWSSRVRSLGGAAPMGEVLHVAPASPAWRAERGPLWRQAADLRRLADAWGASIMVVDSIVVACGGGDPMDPGTPALYAAGLQAVGLPALSIAHVTKEGGLAYPFGSVFWHNLARVTWSLELDGATSILANRKANDQERGGRFVVDVTYRDGLPAEVAERPFMAVLADRVAEALGEGPATVAELASRLAEEGGDDGRPVKDDSLRAALRRGLREQRFTADGPPRAQRWALR